MSDGKKWAAEQAEIEAIEYESERFKRRVNKLQSELGMAGVLGVVDAARKALDTFLKTDPALTSRSWQYLRIVERELKNLS